MRILEFLSLQSSRAQRSYQREQELYVNIANFFGSLSVPGNRPLYKNRTNI